MNKILFSLITFLILTLSQAQTVGNYTVESKIDGYYITETTATGDVTFPTTLEIGPALTVDIVGVESDFISQGAGITSLTIPVGYTTFEGNCFRGMVDLESITFNGGEVFGDKMMRGLANLTTVVLPNTITSWGVEIFSSGSGVETIDLGNCPTINNRMFQNCPITELTLPATVTSIGSQAWKESKIVTLTVEGTTPPVIDAGWEGTAANITAYVPASEISAYQNAPIWENMTILGQPITSTDITVELGDDIQTAINNVANSGGGVVTLASGTHVVTEPLKIRSNITLQGEGDWESVIKTNTNIEVITAYEEGMSNIVIQNLEIEGINGVDGGGIQITSQGTDHDNIQILNVHCIKTGWGVHIKGATNLLVKDCLFEENGAVTKEGFAHNLYIRRVYGGIVKDSKFLNSISANGINISYSSDIEVHNCEMSGNYFRGVRAAVTDGYLVHDCIVKNNGDRGIFANSESGETPTTNVDIKRNCVSGNKLQGIATISKVTGVVADNNSYNNGTNYDLKGTITESGNITDSSLDCVSSINPSIYLTAVSGETSVSLSWNINNIDFESQNLYRSSNSDFNDANLVASDIKGNEYIDDTLENDIIYWYWLQAIDESKETYKSLAIKAAIVTQPKVLLEVESSNGFVTLNWDVFGVELGDTGVLQIFRQVLVSNNEDEQAVQTRRSLIENNVTGSSYIDRDVYNGNTYKYGFKVTDENDEVYNSEEIQATPSESLSIEDNVLNNKISFYPNPIINSLTIVFPMDTVGEYSIFNINGKLNKQGLIPEKSTEFMIDVSNLNTGVYLVYVKGDLFNKIFRVIKK